MPGGPLWEDLEWDRETAQRNLELMLSGNLESGIQPQTAMCPLTSACTFQDFGDLPDINGLNSARLPPSSVLEPVRPVDPFPDPLAEDCKPAVLEGLSAVHPNDVVPLLGSVPVSVNDPTHLRQRTVPRMPSVNELLIEEPTPELEKQPSLRRASPSTGKAPSSHASRDGSPTSMGNDLRCYICQYQASKSWNFRRHMERRHPGAYKLLAQHNCQCGRRFETKQSLCKHVLQTAPHNAECNLTKQEMDISAPSNA